MKMSFLESKLAAISIPHSVILLPATYLLFARDGFKTGGIYCVPW